MRVLSLQSRGGWVKNVGLKFVVLRRDYDEYGEVSTEKFEQVDETDTDPIMGVQWMCQPEIGDGEIAVIQQNMLREARSTTRNEHTYQSAQSFENVERGSSPAKSGHGACHNKLLTCICTQQETDFSSRLTWERDFVTEPSQSAAAATHSRASPTGSEELENWSKSCSAKRRPSLAVLHHHKTGCIEKSVD